ncbi:MAG TPA: hypothetical protein PLL03_04735 [Fervidobacterium sp.]|nr:hypothetical protein [Fervidobacterium sp.]
MTWLLEYGGTSYDVIEVDVTRSIGALNLAKVKCIVDIPIESEVRLRKDIYYVLRGYVKKKTVEDEVVYKYEITEAMGEMSDQIVYEGLKVYNVEGQTIHSIVSDLLTGTGWSLGVMGDAAVGSVNASDQLTVSDGNVDLINGGYKFDVGDALRFVGTAPGGFSTSITYYVVYASSTAIKLSKTEGGHPIVATSTGTRYVSRVIKYMSVYWGKKLNAIFKVVNDIGKMAIWAHTTSKSLFYGYGRTKRGDISTYVLKKEPVEETHKRGYTKVVVLGKTDSVRGVAGTGTKVVVYRYEDASTNDEAEAIAKALLKDLGKVSARLTVSVDIDRLIHEGDIVIVDGVTYFVFDVKESYQELKIGLGAMEKTVFDKLGDKLKEVTGEIGTGVNSTYDGGLQNMGAPSVNCLVSVDKSTSTFAVSDVLDYYSNGDRVVVTSSGTVPSPLVEENVYYVVNINGSNDTFQVAATPGGNPITLTTNGSGLIRVRDLDSQSIPAEFVINIPDVEKIGNLEMTADFSAYRDQMSIGDEVEFLSVPGIIINTSTSQYLNQSTSPIYVPSTSGFAISTPDTGYQYGLVQFIMNPKLTVDTDLTYYDRFDWIIDFEISYDGGATWTTVISTYQAIHRLSANIWIRGVRDSDRTLVSSMQYPVVNCCLLPGVATNKNTVKLRVVVRGGYSYTGKTRYMFGIINCQIVPRHNHIIDKQNNVLKSTLAKNVKCYLTNSEYTEELIYSWDGVVNGERVLTDIHEYLRNGQNILQFYSESPGSVYLNGTYESYSV